LGQAGDPHPHDEVLVLNVNPLLWFPVTSLVFKLEIDVRLPRYAGIIYCDWLRIVKNRISVIEHCLGDQTARVSNILRIQLRHTINSQYFAHLSVGRGRRTGSLSFLKADFFAGQLCLTAWLDVAPVILVEVAKLIVQENWLLHVFRDLKLDIALYSILIRAQNIVKNLMLRYRVGHDQQHDSHSRD
jgi:hypothetical protein